MRRRFYYDADMDAVIERGSNYFEERGQAPSVISDDLKAGVNGLKHIPSGRMIDSKSGHYRENRARGLEHVGNETRFAVTQRKPRADYYVREVIKAQEQIAGDYQGTRSWLDRQREQSRKE